MLDGNSAQTVIAHFEFKPRLETGINFTSNDSQLWSSQIFKLPGKCFWTSSKSLKQHKISNFLTSKGHWFDCKRDVATCNHCMWEYCWCVFLLWWNCNETGEEENNCDSGNVAGWPKQGSEASGREGVVVRETHDVRETHKYQRNTQMLATHKC